MGGGRGGGGMGYMCPCSEKAYKVMGCDVLR